MTRFGETSRGNTMWSAGAMSEPASRSLLRRGSDSPIRGLLLDNRYFFPILEQMTRRGYPGNFELMVMLALIRLGDDAYGVPISREIESRSGREVAIGSVYAALERLEEKRLVSSRVGDGKTLFATLCFHIYYGG